MPNPRLQLVPERFIAGPSLRAPGSGLLARARFDTSRPALARRLLLADRLAAAAGASWGRSRILGPIDGPGSHLVVLACPHEPLGLALLDGADRLAAADDDTAVEHAMAGVLTAWERPAEHALIARAARRRGIPVAWPGGGADGWLVLGHGARAWTYVGGHLTGPGETRGRDIATDKLAAARRLEAAGLPSTRPVVVATVADAVRAARAVGFPVVLKPSRAHAQIGVQPGLRTADDVRRAFRRAATAAGPLGGPLLIERERVGCYVRATLIGGRLAAAFTARAPVAIADGRRDACGLALHAYALRTGGALDRRSHDILRAVLAPQDLRPGDVPVRGRRVRVGFASQGRVRDVTRSLHPGFRALLERIGRAFPLPVAGVDLIVGDLTRPPDPVRDAILEVNAEPSWVGHERPYVGVPRNLAHRLLDVLFPAGCAPRVHVVAGPPGTAEALERLARRDQDRHGFIPAGYTRGRAWAMTPSRPLGEGPAAAALGLLEGATTAYYVEVDGELAREYGLPADRVDRVLPASRSVRPDVRAIEGWLRTRCRWGPARTP